MHSMRRALRHTAHGIFYAVSALIIIVLGSGFAWEMHLAANKVPIKQYFSTKYTNALWDWDDPTKTSQGSLDALSEFMYLHQLNALYLDTSAYATILDNGPMNAEKQAQLTQMDDALNRYVTTLAKRNIKVYAVGGDVSWSNPPEWYIPLSIMHQVEQYNLTHPSAQLAGVEFDIEAYNQPGFASSSMTAKSLVLGDYLSMVDTLADEDARYVGKGKHTLELGFAIPYWFDDQNGNIPPVTQDNLTGPTLFHLLDRLNQLPKSNVVVMAYRNQAKGNDGIIFHARNNVNYAQAKAPHVRVIIGQETNDVQPAKITYYGSSASDLSNQVSLVEQEFGPSGVLGGIAINDLTGYQQLPDN